MLLRRSLDDDDPMSDRADVAVVVPTRDRAVLVDRLLDQLVRPQEGLRHEVIVIDEASSDETPALLERYRRDHGIHVVRHDPPRGLSGARNAGVEASSAAHLAWIDDDDLTAPDRLSRQHAALRSTGARWSCTGMVDIDDDLTVIGHARCRGDDGSLRSLLRFNTLPATGQGLLVERSLLDEVGPFDETLDSAEDWDFVIRLAAVTPPHLIDEPLVGYRTGVPSMSTNTARMERAIEQVIAKHGALYEAEGVEPDWGAIHQSLLPADLRTGRRPAASRAWRSVRAKPSGRAIARCAMAVAAPDRYLRRSQARRRQEVPPEWVDRAGRWLADVKRV